MNIIEICKNSFIPVSPHVSQNNISNYLSNDISMQNNISSYLSNDISMQPHTKEGFFQI